MESFEIQGQIVDLEALSIFPGALTVVDSKIIEVRKLEHASGQFIIPGFVDAHVHIESSMLVPSEFARLAVVHGTVATVSDPHEIGNVLGVPGVRYMIENGRMVNFKFYFGAPSCVPATPFETAGAAISREHIESLLADPNIYYLAEMMNWPGVLDQDSEVIHKIQLAKKYLKPVDGHAPGLRGSQARAYANAGITTDHECFTREEALDKLASGMHIIIREGSAAKNFEALISLLPEYAHRVMFCSDDKHPDNLVDGHINILARRAVARGIDPLLVLRSACLNPVRHYKLDVGQLNEGDPADFTLVQDLRDFSVLGTFINGRAVSEGDKSLLPSVGSKVINNFTVSPKLPVDFRIPAIGPMVKAMVAEDGQLITRQRLVAPRINNGMALSDPKKDLLKITVVNRYEDAPPALGFIQNFGLKSGAIASSVAHDSHNIIALGVEDEDICEAVNQVIKHNGGVVALSGSEKVILPLPIAGLMSAEDGYQVAEKYLAVDSFAKKLGSALEAPFMTLSFMALLVIPELKLSDKGLFDGVKFEFVPLFQD